MCVVRRMCLANRTETSPFCSTPATFLLQAAALQLLSALKSLRVLQLGGAELLLPSIPHFPVAAVHAPPAPPAPAAPALAAAGAADAPQQPALLPQLSTSMSLTTAAAALAGNQTELMRAMLLAKAADLQQFKLQFNCCGTGVEKVGRLLSPERGCLSASSFLLQLELAVFFSQPSCCTANVTARHSLSTTPLNPVMCATHPAAPWPLSLLPARLCLHLVTCVAS